MTSPNRQAANFTCTLVLPWPLKLDDGRYPGRHGANGYAVHLRFMDVSGELEAEATGSVQFRLATGELTEASRGTRAPGAMLQYTEATVEFAKPVTAIPVPRNEQVKARRLAHRFLNHFLDLYRYMASDAGVAPLTWAEFHHIRAGRALVCTVAPENPAALAKAAGGGPIMLRSIGIVFRDEEPVSTQFGARPVMDQAKTTEFCKSLAAGLTPSIPALLLLNAEHHAEACDWRLAILDASTALDVIVEHAAADLLVHRGMLLAEAQAKLEKLGTLSIFRDVLSGGITLDLESSPDYLAWAGSHRKLRNRVVHDGYEPSEIEGSEALRSIVRLVHLVDQATPM